MLVDSVEAQVTANVTNFITGIRAANKTLDAFLRRLTSADTKLTSLTTTFQNVAAHVAPVAAGLAEAAVALRDTSLAGKECKTSLNQLDKSVGDTNKEAGEASDGLLKYSKSLRSVAISVGVVGAAMSALIARPFVAFIDAAVVSFAKFDDQLRRINTVARVSERALFDMGNTILAMSQRFGNMPFAIAEAMENIQQASFGGADAVALLTQSLVTAKGAGAEVADVSGILTSTLLAYGLSTEYLTDVSDVLFKTQERGIVTVAQLSRYLGKVIPVAVQAGVRFDELGAAIAAMTKQSIQPAPAHTAMLNIISQMLKPTKELNALFRDTGGAASAIKKIGFPAVMERIAVAVKKSDDAISKLFPNKRALIGVTALVSNNMRIFREELGLVATQSGRAGATALAFAERMKAVQFAFDRLTASVDVFYVTFMRDFAKEIAFITNLFTSFIQAITGAPKSVKIAFLAIGAALAAIGPIVLLVAGALITLDAGLGVLAAAPAAFAKLGITLVGVKAAVAGLFSTAALATFATALAAVVILGSALYGVLKEVSVQLNKLFADFPLGAELLSGIGKAASSLAAAVHWFVGAVVLLFQVVVKGFATTLTIFYNIGEFLGEALGAIIDTIYAIAKYATMTPAKLVAVAITGELKQDMEGLFVNSWSRIKARAEESGKDIAKSMTDAYNESLDLAGEFDKKNKSFAELMQSGNIMKSVSDAFNKPLALDIPESIESISTQYANAAVRGSVEAYQGEIRPDNLQVSVAENTERIATNTEGLITVLGDMSSKLDKSSLPCVLE